MAFNAAAFFAPNEPGKRAIASLHRSRAVRFSHFHCSPANRWYLVLWSACQRATATVTSAQHVSFTSLERNVSSAFK